MGRLFVQGFIKHMLMEEAGGEGNSGGGGGGNSDDASNDNNDNNGNNEDDGNNDDDDNNNDNVESLPDWTQKLIKDLRSENASNRTKNKELGERFGNLEKGLKSALGIEDDSTPEEQLQGLTAQNHQLVMRNAVLETAVLNGLDGDQSEFFGYLLEKEIEATEEDELSDDVISTLIAKAKGMSGGSGKAADSSVDGEGSGSPASNGEGSALTAEQFAALGYGKKVALRKENEVLYNKLHNEARLKGLIK